MLLMNDDLLFQREEHHAWKDSNIGRYSFSPFVSGLEKPALTMSTCLENITSNFCKAVGLTIYTSWVILNLKSIITHLLCFVLGVLVLVMRKQAYDSEYF